MSKVTATLHSVGDALRNRNSAQDKGTINFTPLDESENNWDVEIDKDCLSFFGEVWPYVTMGELTKMRKQQMVQIMWSAYGYGVTVKVNGDTRW